MKTSRLERLWVSLVREWIYIYIYISCTISISMVSITNYSIHIFEKSNVWIWKISWFLLQSQSSYGFFLSFVCSLNVGADDTSPFVPKRAVGSPLPPPLAVSISIQMQVILNFQEGRTNFLIRLQYSQAVSLWDRCYAFLFFSWMTVQQAKMERLFIMASYSL